MKRFMLAASVAAIFLSGCTTITRGSNDVWEITTTPIGAEVSTSNGYHCESTPCAIRMPRRSEFVATVTMDGFNPATVNVTHRISGAGGAGMAGNVLVGGVIGAAVDMSTGAMNDLVPNPVHLELVPLGTGTGTPRLEGGVDAVEDPVHADDHEHEDAGDEAEIG